MWPRGEQRGFLLPWFLRGGLKLVLVQTERVFVPQRAYAQGTCSEEGLKVKSTTSRAHTHCPTYTEAVPTPKGRKPRGKGPWWKRHGLG